MTIKIIDKILKCRYCSLKWLPDEKQYMIIRTENGDKRVFYGDTLAAIADNYWIWIMREAQEE